MVDGTSSGDNGAARAHELDADVELADARRQVAVEARRAERIERTILAEEATFESVLIDAVGRGDDVLVEMSTGRRHAGFLSAIGTDFVLLHPTGAAPVALRTAELVTLHRHRAGARSQSAAPVTDLAEVLAELAAVDATARLVLDGGATVHGVVSGVGRDVVTVLTQPAGDVVYLVLAAVNEVSSMSMTSSS